MNIRFYPVECINRNGEKYMSKWQSHNYKFLMKIMNMDKKKPISYADAIRTFLAEFDRITNTGDHDKAVKHLQSDKIDYISSIGYHIELTGDEWFDLNGDATA